MKSSKNKPGERCEHCREPLDRVLVQVYRRRGKRHVLFQRVPALVCRACGRRIFEAVAVEAMEHALNQPPVRERKKELTIISV